MRKQRGHFSKWNRREGRKDGGMWEWQEGWRRRAREHSRTFRPDRVKCVTEKSGEGLFPTQRLSVIFPVFFLKKHNQNNFIFPFIIIIIDLAVMAHRKWGAFWVDNKGGKAAWNYWGARPGWKGDAEHPLWKPVPVSEACLSMSGFQRTGKQCKANFKPLKATFFEAVEHWQRVPLLKGQPPHSETLWRL